MRKRNENPLFRELATACPRTNVRMDNPQQGGFDILWKNNLSKLQLEHYTTADGSSFISESEEPFIYQENGRLVEQPDYTLLHLTDDKGRMWIVETLSPITEGQEICFNLVEDGNAIRFIYGFCTDTGKQEIQRVSLEVDAEKKNRFVRDNFVARYQYVQGVREHVSTKLRLRQVIEQETVLAGEQRNRSHDYHHVQGIDGEKAIQLIVDNDFKLIADNATTQYEEQAEFVEVLSCVTETSRLAIQLPLSSEKELLFTADTALAGSGSVRMTFISGGVTTCYPQGQMIAFNPQSLVQKQQSEALSRNGTNIQDFISWSKQELRFVSQAVDEIFMISTDQRR